VDLAFPVSDGVGIMGTARELPPVAKTFGPDNARRCGRVRVEMITCCLGDVLDLSATGMRVRSKGRVPQEGQTLGVRIEGMIKPIDVRATVVWARKSGWRKMELGLRFEDVTQEIRSELAAIARTAPLNEVLGKPLDGKRRAG
jgi:hypothetical protein